MLLLLLLLLRLCLLVCSLGTNPLVGLLLTAGAAASVTVIRLMASIGGCKKAGKIQNAAQAGVPTAP
jgi:hypothetical protein